MPSGFRGNYGKYDSDLKKEVVEYANSNSLRETSKKFKIPYGTIHMWVRNDEKNK